MKPNHKTLKQLAKKVLIASEKYTTDTEAKIAMFDDLTGMCAISSMVLSKVLKKEGFPATIMIGPFGVNGFDHCWVESNDMLIDVTTRQFGLPDIQIIPLTKKTKFGYPVGKELTNLKTEFKSWPHEQTPTNDKLNIILDLIG